MIDREKLNLSWAYSLEGCSSRNDDACRELKERKYFGSQSESGEMKL